jgi:hypothetical protein
MKRAIAYLFSLSVLFMSCEKEIEIELDTADQKLVIEGAITNEPGPYKVSLTRTVGFSDSNDYPGVGNAIVVISTDTGSLDTLTYSSNGMYWTNTIVGMPGVVYTLDVFVDGTHYKAQSRMPDLVPLEGIEFIPFAGPGGGDSFSVLPNFIDPPEFGNNYRFIQTINNTVDNSYVIYNDNVNNGLANQRPVFSPTNDIVSGDVVELEMRCVDLNTYNYYFTLSQMAFNGPGGGTTPSNPPSGFSEDVLGVFSAYTIQRSAGTAPK